LAAVGTALAVATTVAWSAGLDKRTAQIERALPGRALFALPAAAPTDVARGYLRARGRSESVLASLSAVRAGTDTNGITHLRFEQDVDGLEVYGAYFKGAVNQRGELVHAIDRLAGVSRPTPARVDAAAALQAAMARVHPAESASFRRIRRGRQRHNVRWWRVLPRCADGDGRCGSEGRRLACARMARRNVDSAEQPAASHAG
jgi:hypothetical protein